MHITEQRNLDKGTEMNIHGLSHFLCYICNMNNL